MKTTRRKLSLYSFFVKFMPLSWTHDKYGNFYHKTKTLWWEHQGKRIMRVWDENYITVYDETQSSEIKNLVENYERYKPKTCIYILLDEPDPITEWPIPNPDPPIQVIRTDDSNSDETFFEH